MRRFLSVTDTGSETLTSNTQPQKEVSPSVLGDITSFEIETTASATGTLVSANGTNDVVNTIAISDKNHKSLESFYGSEIPYLAFLTSPRGTYTAPTTVTSTSATDKWEIALPAKLAAQPLFVKVTLAAYSALASSGATGGSGEVVINAYYEDDPAIQAGIVTHGVTFFDLGTVNGSTDLSPNLTKGQNLVQLAWRMTSASDSNFTYYTLNHQGNVYFSEEKTSAMVARDTIATVSGHQAGFFISAMSPFVPDSTTYFHIQGSAADTARVYQVLLSPTGL